ncbi:MAG: RIP metalloprotease RseP [Gammaproteobacteria bacterium]
MDFIHTLFFFIVAIAVLIAFHEYGHFWVARKVGVKVLRFSIGFGSVLWRRQKSPDATEFVICAVPLGGYVKMVDEREGPVASADLPLAFNRQPLLKRIAIVSAGPIFNLLLAVILFWFIFVYGETGMRPIIGPVEQGTYAAQAGFIEGEEIVAVDDKTTPTWMETLAAIFSAMMEDNQAIRVEVKSADGIQTTKTITIPKTASRKPEEFVKSLGLVPWTPKLAPVVGNVLKNSPAAAAGLRAGDLIVDADGMTMNDWTQWVEYVRKRPGVTIQLMIERDGAGIPLQITPEAVDSEQGLIGKIGVAVEVPEEQLKALQVEYRLPPFQALATAVKRTAYYSWSTLKMMAYMLVGKASVENLSGPISIAQYAGQTASMGLVHFLKFLAIISISLGVLNLLPIPVLDGGHLLFYAIEGLKGSPVSEQTQLLFQQIGIAILITLMSFAFFIDIGRLMQ